MENLGERTAKNEVELKNLDFRLKNLEEDKKILYKLSIIAEQNSETIKQTTTQITRMHETFDKINENLTNLNFSQKELKEDVKNIAVRVSEVEKDLHEEVDSGKISFNDILNKYAFWILMLPTTIIGYFVMKWLGGQ